VRGIDRSRGEVVQEGSVVSIDAAGEAETTDEPRRTRMKTAGGPGETSSPRSYAAAALAVEAPEQARGQTSDPCSSASIRGAAFERLLIVKLSSLGDVAQALPVASALRRRFPALRLTWAVEEPFAPLLYEHPAVDRVVTFPRLAWGALARGWPAAVRRALRVVQEEPYDVALDLQGLFKSSLIAWGSRAPLRLGVSPQREGAGWVSRAIPVAGGRRHAVDHYLECAAFLGAPAAAEFGLRVQPLAAAALARRLEQCGVAPGAPLIAIGPSPARPSKRWPERHWAAVADALADAGTVVLVGSAEHVLRHRRVAERARRRPLDLTGATTLAELVALLDRCALHLAPDTGTLHLAAALRRPVLGIYGPTPAWRLGPYGQPQGALQHAGACGVGCPRLCVRRRRCLRAVTPDEVIARARQILAQHPAAAP
jgi:lipopolysaccharide heptosyltransferase I